MSVNRTSLGKRISFYRSKSNLTQEVLAAKVNCSREYIVQIENGTKVPSLSVLVKIANTLSVSADELLLDCLEYSSSSANSEIHRLLLDCNETEQTVIIRICLRLFCLQFDNLLVDSFQRINIGSNGCDFSRKCFPLGLFFYDLECKISSHSFGLILAAFGSGHFGLPLSISIFYY
jgi:transcriptional regulator with XRE-family HTH domain